MTFPIGDLFSNFLKNPGSDEETINAAYRELGLVPPREYVAAMQFTDGGEGFIGQSYLRLYSSNRISELNRAYQISVFAQGLVLFGSNGGGEAYCFETRNGDVEIVQLPFIPMDFKHIRRFGGNFLQFLTALRDEDAEDISIPQIKMSAVGREVHEVLPIIFGGSPTDPKNKILVTPDEHAQYVLYWNKLYRDLIRTRSTSTREI